MLIPYAVGCRLSVEITSKRAQFLSMYFNTKPKAQVSV